MQRSNIYHGNDHVNVQAAVRDRVCGGRRLHGAKAISLAVSGQSAAQHNARMVPDAPSQTRHVPHTLLGKRQCHGRQTSNRSRGTPLHVQVRSAAHRRVRST